MIVMIRKLHILWSIWYYSLLNKTREAFTILKYARANGFPHGDEEYSRILKEAGFKPLCIEEE